MVLVVFGSLLARVVFATWSQGPSCDQIGYNDSSSRSNVWRNDRILFLVLFESTTSVSSATIFEAVTIMVFTTLFKVTTGVVPATLFEVAIAVVPTTLFEAVRALFPQPSLRRQYSLISWLSLFLRSFCHFPQSLQPILWAFGHKIFHILKGLYLSLPPVAHGCLPRVGGNDLQGFGLGLCTDVGPLDPRGMPQVLAPSPFHEDP